jgi:hypothetical protein
MVKPEKASWSDPMASAEFLSVLLPLITQIIKALKPLMTAAQKTEIKKLVK